MKRKYQSFIIILLIMLFLVSLLLNSEIIFTSSINAFNTWLYKVFPYLLPMFIISDLLLNYNFPYYLAKLFKFTKINPNIIFIFMMSMISGFPSSAKYIKEMYLNNYINKEEAESALIYSYFPNPLFISSICNIIFKNSYITLLIFIILYSINIVFFIFIKKSNNFSIQKYKNNTLSFNEILSKSIPNSINTLIMILGTMVIFNIIGSIITNVFNLNNAFSTIILGLLEFSQGLNNLIYLDISAISKVLLVILFTSFGGFCVQMQIKSILMDTNLSLKSFYITKILILLFILGLFFLCMLF